MTSTTPVNAADRDALADHIAALPVADCLANRTHDYRDGYMACLVRVEGIIRAMLDASKEPVAVSDLVSWGDSGPIPGQSFGDEFAALAPATLAVPGDVLATVRALVNRAPGYADHVEVPVRMGTLRAIAGVADLPVRTEDRKTFVVPDGYEAVFDNEGRATGEVRPLHVQVNAVAWQTMETAPKDGSEILVRRHNDCFYEHDVVWWSIANEECPWATNHGGGYPEGRLDEWMPLPREEDDVTAATRSLAEYNAEGGEGVGSEPLTYGQKLIAEAIEAHFGERVEDYDEDVDDTSNHDAWEAFDAALSVRSQP